ncbi:hypothetical protein PG997_011764 [Apiospora hydei]|uniref:Uncharacterized protein n=1 Tax=Apiospora hydei TaxID=1337664 RepID=A0ABR1V255_9PEZI
MFSPEVIVALALGIPSLFVAVAALWIAYLTYTRQSPPHVNRTTSWPPFSYPPLSPSGGSSWASSGCSVGDDDPAVPQAAFPAEGQPVRRRPVELES